MEINVLNPRASLGELNYSPLSAVAPIHRSEGGLNPVEWAQAIPLKPGN